MALPYPDPSNPALPSPLFSDLTAVRADHMRANNAAIFGDLTALDERNPAAVVLSNGSFKTAALANANTYTGRSLFLCTAGVSDTPYAAVWRIVGFWDSGGSTGRFVAMLGSSLETWEINYSGAAWGTWTKHTDGNGNQFANNFVSGYNTTATSGGTLTLTVASAPNQFFTGSSNHTVTLPVVSTLSQGFLFVITNTSTGVITVNSSGGNLVSSVPPNTQRNVMCILTSGTDASSWFVSYDALPVGFEMEWAGLTPPTNFIVKDGASLLRSSYPGLFTVLAGKTASVTNITIGSNAVFTSNGHGLSTFQCVSHEGTVPGGITAGLSYFVTVVDVNTYKLSDTMAHAVAGNYITTSGSYSNVILRYSSWGTADINHFNNIDERGIGTVGAGTQGTATGWAGSLSNHVGIIGYYEEDRFQGHLHGTSQRDTQWFNVLEGAITSAIKYPAGTPPTEAMFPTSTNGVHGTPRTGYITKAARVGKLKVIKYQ